MIFFYFGKNSETSRGFIYFLIRQFCPTCRIVFGSSMSVILKNGGVHPISNTVTKLPARCLKFEFEKRKLYNQTALVRYSDVVQPPAIVGYAIEQGWNTNIRDAFNNRDTSRRDACKIGSQRELGGGGEATAAETPATKGTTTAETPITARTTRAETRK